MVHLNCGRPLAAHPRRPQRRQPLLGLARSSDSAKRPHSSLQGAQKAGDSSRRRRLGKVQGFPSFSSQEAHSAIVPSFVEIPTPNNARHSPQLSPNIQAAVVAQRPPRRSRNRDSGPVVTGRLRRALPPVGHRPANSTMTRPQIIRAGTCCSLPFISPAPGSWVQDPRPLVAAKGPRSNAPGLACSTQLGFLPHPRL